MDGRSGRQARPMDSLSALWVGRDKSPTVCAIGQMRVWSLAPTGKPYKRAMRAKPRESWFAAGFPVITLRPEPRGTDQRHAASRLRGAPTKRGWLARTGGVWVACARGRGGHRRRCAGVPELARHVRNLHSRSEEHTSELQSRENLVCRLLLEK